MINNTTNDFYNIVINELPLIDVRAPIEYEKGAFKNSVNLPIMNNEERRLVGICYKEKGNDEAVKLGHKLVSGDIKEARIKAWTDFITKYPDCKIYCFRGGQRSRLSQEWIADATGMEIPRLEGGYKAFRNYLINALDPSELKSTPIILGGYTGSGKTILLKRLDNSIDLEGLANHRGSSFGQFIEPQPSQINFENNLAYALIKHRHKGYRYMILEDEGRHIGRCFIPKPLADYFKKGLLVVLNKPLEERIIITMDEYVTKAQDKYIKRFGLEDGLKSWYEYISNSLFKIKKRLGEERYKSLLDLFNVSYREQLSTGSYSPHCKWIEVLLKDYYDPMYEYQLKNTTKKIVFSGNTKEVEDYLNSL